MRQNRRHPHDTYSTDSYSGDKHRNPCISDTAECTGKDFDGNVGKEGRNQEMDQSVTAVSVVNREISVSPINHINTTIRPVIRNAMIMLVRTPRCTRSIFFAP